LKRENLSAVIIQALYRGHLAKKTHQEKMNRFKSSTKLFAKVIYALAILNLSRKILDSSPNSWKKNSGKIPCDT
jgi:IQ calmodulin-binding motif